ncbi:MAG: S41 family peptidase [Suipraeoptans sp.]
MNKKSFLKGALSGALVMFLIVGTISCGNIIKKMDSDSTNNTTTNSETTGSFEVDDKISVLRQYINEKYMGDIDDADLEDGVYKGLISGLDDPYSEYYTEEETKQLLENISGEYSGIGAILSQDKDSGAITILQVYKDSPAEEAGLMAEDILLKVGDRELTSKDDISEVVTHIKGKEGTAVELTVYREKTKKEVTVKVTRRMIEAQTVTYEMKEDNIGYISVSEFDEVTTDQYEKALSDLEGQGMEGLVVDLRNNPGGSLGTVTAMLDLMLPKCLTVYMEDKNGERTNFESDAEHTFDKPLVVLVNGNSASASEIFAGAIQDHKAGTIMGSQTYGKGVVQKTFDLEDGTSVKLTIAAYFTPNGRNINDVGITPDKEVEYKEDEENPDADNQLQESISHIKEEINAQ